MTSNPDVENELSAMLAGDDPLVVMPWQSPMARTLGTAQREAILAGVLVGLTAAADLVTRMLTDESLFEPRVLVLLILGILLKAAMTVASKWYRSQED